MPRLKNKEVKLAVDLCQKRDGVGCFYNKNGHPCAGDIVLHHVDNNPDNNDPRNWRLACTGHNHRLNPRGSGKRGIRVKAQIDNRHKKPSIREREREREKLEVRPRVQSAEFEKNKVCEPAFRHWIIKTIKKFGSITLDDAVDGGAEYVGCSQQTIRRYLRKMCSNEGILEIDDKNPQKVVLIRFKEKFKLMRAPEILSQQAKNWKSFTLSGNGKN